METWDEARRELIRAARRAVKQAAAVALDRSGARRWIAERDRRRAGGRRVQIFAWHRVVPDFDRMVRRVIPGLLTSTETFERQLAWLRENYEVVSLDEALEALAGGRRGERDLCVLTFDDGYLDFAEHAAPVLRRLGLPALVYVTSGVADSGLPLLHDRLYHLLRLALRRRIEAREGEVEPRVELALRRTLALRDPIVGLEWILKTQPRRVALQVAKWLERRLGERPEAALADSRLLGWEDLRGLDRELFSVGAHTVDHACLPNESPAEVERQLVESKREIEAQLGREVAHFAYPNGWYSPSVVRAVEKAGYRSATTTEDLPNHVGISPYRLRRRCVWEYASRGLWGFSLAVHACNFDGTLRSLGLSPWVSGERPDGLGDARPPQDSPAGETQTALSRA
ncbi:MAG: polysaccharide deacetylase family protein [Pseudomonadota bacterium]|nr:MAG: polysaccharide deacetylase [Pseudomonadota bacterium]